jgi:hypothetical protein
MRFSRAKRLREKRIIVFQILNLAVNECRKKAFSHVLKDHAWSEKETGKRRDSRAKTGTRPVSSGEIFPGKKRSTAVDAGKIPQMAPSRRIKIYQL